MKSISTHVLDTSLGRPASGIAVTIERKEPAGHVSVGSGTTDADGRVKELVPEGKLVRGVYRVHFDLAAYFASRAVESFYPEATIVFTVKDENAHYHVPLLLSPYGYSTYRGS